MIPVVDGHNDALLRVWRSGGSLRERSEEGQLDLPRMREGGIAAGFFAIFVPATDVRPDYSVALRRTAEGYAIPLDPPMERFVAFGLAANRKVISHTPSP